ncbi:hypothetical protein C2E23DRAFT_856608 [Lenzites betulinus]|nr:hypothetical protein C2E23DRAFT_856608 [Lenzites betulinus]
MAHVKVNVRCKHYTDNGVPRGGGCTFPACRFRHPNDPEWPHARMYVPGFGRGRGGRGGRGGRDLGSQDRWATGKGGGTQDDASSKRSGWGDSFDAPRWGDSSSAPARGESHAETSAAGRSADWGAPPSASPTVKNTDWGAPAATGTWGEPTVIWDAPIAPPPAAVPAPPPPGSWATAAQQSPVPENKTTEETTSPSSSNPAASPTLQWGMGTPHTPFSPDRSPAQRMQTADPRRRPQVTTTVKAAGSATSPAEDTPKDATAPREVRKELRLLSNGVPVPVTLAGASGSSSSKPNPFSFPTYSPAEKMDVVQEPSAQSTARAVDMADALDPDAPASPIVSTLPATALGQWKTYTQLFTKAVALSLELVALREQRDRYRALQHSAQFKDRSARSMAAANAQLTRIRADAEEKRVRVQRRFDACLDSLARFPVTGPPSTADPPRSQEVADVDAWAGGLRGWMDTVRPAVQEHQEKERARIWAQQQAEEEARARAEAEAAKREETRVRVAAVTSRTASLEDGLTDLEERMTNLQMTALDADKIVVRVLQERLGVSLATPTSSQLSVEEGEVPPQPPMTHSELTARCAELSRQLQECIHRSMETQQLIVDEITKNQTKKAFYHDLAADQARMEVRLHKLLEVQATSTSVQDLSKDKEIHDLRTELQAYRDREPPPPPPVITFEQVAGHVLPILRPELQSALEEAVGVMVRGVDEALTKQQEDICLQVWQAFQPVMRLIQRVSQMSSRQPELFMPPPPPPVLPQCT